MKERVFKYHSKTVSRNHYGCCMGRDKYSLFGPSKVQLDAKFDIKSALVPEIWIVSRKGIIA